jgi:hypothetical protein
VKVPFIVRSNFFINNLIFIWIHKVNGRNTDSNLTCKNKGNNNKSFEINKWKRLTSWHFKTAFSSAFVLSFASLLSNSGCLYFFTKRSFRTAGRLRNVQRKSRASAPWQNGLSSRKYNVSDFSTISSQFASSSSSAVILSEVWFMVYLKISIKKVPTYQSKIHWSIHLHR